MKSKEQKNIYERTLRVTAILIRTGVSVQYTFTQHKKRDEAFSLVINGDEELFDLDDIVILTVKRQSMNIRKTI